jgi:hypothetical protein
MDVFSFDSEVSASNTPDPSGKFFRNINPSNLEIKDLARIAWIDGAGLDLFIMSIVVIGINQVKLDYKLKVYHNEAKVSL